MNEKVEKVLTKALDDVNYKLYYLEMLQKLIGESCTNERQHREVIGNIYESLREEKT